MNILVFGSNEQGFHGAGGAGLAMRNDSSNTWRSDPAFLAAMNAPRGSPLRIGHRAIFGISRGFQQGHAGASYAICTVTRPGHRRSIPLSDIASQLHALATFARSRPDDTFDILNIGTGYAGYTSDEMAAIWCNIPLPPNCTRRPVVAIHLS